MSHKTKNKLNHTWMWGIGVSIFAVIVLIGGVTFINLSKKTFDYVGKVNGEPISTKLFYAQLVKQRAEVYSYFNTKYEAYDSKEFWTASFGGEIPIEAAREKALNECVTIMVQQELAKKKGVMKDISYDAFLEALKEENIRRKEAIEQNKVIYGPVEYSEDNYFSYVFSNMIIGLKSALEEELEITDEAIQDMYEAKKETVFKIQSVRVEIISIPLDSTGSVKAKEKCEEILKRLDSGEKFENLAKEYNVDQKLLEQVFDNTTKRGDIRSIPKIRNVALDLKAGQISTVVEDNDSLSILKCIEHKEIGYEEYEQVKDKLKTLLIDDKYKELVDKNIKAAKLTTDKKAIESVVIE